MPGMNRLPAAARAQILTLLCEGSSMRSVSRIAGVSINTVTKLLEDAGRACAEHHDATVRGVRAKRVQCDEIWSFCYAKAKNVAGAKAVPDEAGDVWTWTALDADSKLIVSYLIGGRDAGYADEFMRDVAGRLATLYGQTPEGPAGSAQRRYSPGECVGTRKAGVTGRPDPAHVSTSYAERQNLTMRMSMRRFTRLTNAFSKKAENHAHMVALYTTWYNFVRIHKTLRVTPAMAAGVTAELWEMTDVVALLDAREAVPAKRGSYKPRAAKVEVSN
jgi:IS1 family transposase